MRLSGFTCSVAVVALVVTWGLVLWLAPEDESPGGAGPRGTGNGTAQALDREARLGMEAAKREAVGRPRSLHADGGHDSPRRQQTQRQRTAQQPDLDRPAGTHLVVRLRPGSRVRIHTEPNGELAGIAGDRTEFGSPTVFSVVRREGNWIGVSTPAVPNGRLGWVRFNPQRVDLGWTERSIHVNLSERRATLREDDRELRTFTVTVGAPGTETPTGRFAVTDTFRGGLNPVYGCCAVALTATQPDLPPGWPGGNRIALHGNGTGQPLGIAASNGCLRAEDRQVDALINEINLGTPVFIYQ